MRLQEQKWKACWNQNIESLFEAGIERNMTLVDICLKEKLDPKVLCSGLVVRGELTKNLRQRKGQKSIKLFVRGPQM